MRYTTHLPSIHITESKLQSLEKLIREETTAPELTIELYEDTTVYDYTSSEELLNDPKLPAHFRRFTIELTSAEGELEIEADNSSERQKLELEIAGEDDWVRQKQANIEAFFDAQGDQIRARFEEHPWLITGAVIGILAYGSLLLNVGSQIGIQTIDDVLLTVIMGSIAAGLLKELFDKLDPYVLLSTNDREPLYPNLKKLAYVLSILGSVVAFNAVFRG